MIDKKEIENAIRDSIRKISGGHSLESLSGEKLWHTDEVINITAIAEMFIELTSREAELEATIRELRESLKKICVYDIYDCSESSDINYHNDAKDMYEIAKQALENTKDI